MKRSARDLERLHERVIHRVDDQRELPLHNLREQLEYASITKQILADAILGYKPLGNSNSLREILRLGNTDMLAQRPNLDEAMMIGRTGEESEEWKRTS